MALYPCRPHPYSWSYVQPCIPLQFCTCLNNPSGKEDRCHWVDRRRVSWVGGQAAKATLVSAQGKVSRGKQRLPLPPPTSPLSSSAPLGAFQAPSTQNSQIVSCGSKRDREIEVEIQGLRPAVNFYELLPRARPGPLAAGFSAADGGGRPQGTRVRNEVGGGEVFPCYNDRSRGQGVGARMVNFLQSSSSPIKNLST